MLCRGSRAGRGDCYKSGKCEGIHPPLTDRGGCTESACCELIDPGFETQEESSHHNVQSQRDTAVDAHNTKNERETPVPIVGWLCFVSRRTREYTRTTGDTPARSSQQPVRDSFGTGSGPFFL